MRSQRSYRLRRLQRALLARLALIFPRFRAVLATPTPLVKMEYRGEAHSKTLIIFLPGLDDLAEDFERRGIVDEMRLQGVTADAVALDAHYGYYAEEVILERITDDIICKAHDAGYESIWLAGISLGGFGAALYAAHHARRINGLLLFAPYLGDETLIREIRLAGGMSNWEPGPVEQTDHQRSLWAWFKRHLSQEHAELEIYLGYGSSDKFANANRLLSATLNPKHVFEINGGHNWKTWKTIWMHFLLVLKEDSSMNGQLNQDSPDSG